MCTTSSGGMLIVHIFDELAYLEQLSSENSSAPGSSPLEFVAARTVLSLNYLRQIFALHERYFVSPRFTFPESPNSSACPALACIVTYPGEWLR